MAVISFPKRKAIQHIHIVMCVFSSIRCPSEQISVRVVAIFVVMPTCVQISKFLFGKGDVFTESIFRGLHCEISLQTTSLASS